MRRYLQLTRTLTYSLLFAAPLLVLYELGAVWLARSSETDLRNGADVLLRTLLIGAGVEGTMAFTALLLGAATVAILLEQRRARVPIRAAPFLGMLVESLGYAMAFGAVVGSVTGMLLDGLDFRLAADVGVKSSLSLSEGIVLSLGAGIYEELVFRILLVGGLFAVLRSSGLGRKQSGAFSAIVAALLFAAFHYIGPYGDPWALPSFLFRFLAGLAFSVLFLIRGFGIAAWTHALYDVLLFAFRGV